MYPVTRRSTSRWRPTRVSYPVPRWVVIDTHPGPARGGGSFVGHHSTGAPSVTWGRYARRRTDRMDRTRRRSGVRDAREKRCVDDEERVESMWTTRARGIGGNREGESGVGDGGGDRTGTLRISIGMRFDRIRARWSARESGVGGARGVMERLTRVSWTVGGPNSIFGGDRDEKR